MVYGWIGVQRPAFNEIFCSGKSVGSGLARLIVTTMGCSSLLLVSRVCWRTGSPTPNSLAQSLMACNLIMCAIPETLTVGVGLSVSIDVASTLFT